MEKYCEIVGCVHFCKALGKSISDKLVDNLDINAVNEYGADFITNNIECETESTYNDYCFVLSSKPETIGNFKNYFNDSNYSAKLEFLKKNCANFNTIREIFKMEQI